MRPSYLPVQYEHCPYCGGIMSATNNQREMILKWHKGKAATPEYTAKLLGLPLSEVLYVIEHPEPPKSRADAWTPEFIEPLV